MICLPYAACRQCFNVIELRRGAAWGSQRVTGHRVCCVFHWRNNSLQTNLELAGLCVFIRGLEMKIIQFYCSRALCPCFDPSVTSDPDCQSPPSLSLSLSLSLSSPSRTRPLGAAGSHLHLPSASLWDVPDLLLMRLLLNIFRRKWVFTAIRK